MAGYWELDAYGQGYEDGLVGNPPERRFLNRERSWREWAEWREGHRHGGRDADALDRAEKAFEEEAARVSAIYTDESIRRATSTRRAR